MVLASPSAEPSISAPSSAPSIAPDSGKRAKTTAHRVRPAFRYALIAVSFFAGFWVFAAASDWFLDAPFLYNGPDQWSQNLLKASARGLHSEESALYVISLLGVVPAILFAALTLREVRSSPLDAIRRYVAANSRRVNAMLALVAVLLAWCGYHFVLRGAELIDDERSYLFAARNIVSGTLFRDAAPAAFRNPMVLTAPVWISKYSPGFPALLSPGLLLGLPRLMPSIVCGLSVFGMFQLAKSLFGLRSALAASIFWAFSPFQLAIHSTTMIFGTSGCLALWTGALVARALLRGDERALFGAALLSLVHVLVRPFDAALVMGTLGLVIVAFGGGWAPVRRLAILGAGLALGVLGHALFNQRVFGTALSSGYTAAKDYNFGFFVRSLPGFSYVHTPTQAIAHVLVACARLDGWLIGVPGTLLFAALTLINPNRREQALLLALVLHWVGYSLMASSGTFDVGPTYYYLVAPYYLLLAIRGALRVKLTLAPKYRSVLAWASVAVLPIVWLTIVPVRLIRLAELATAIRAPWDYLAASQLSEGLVVVPPARGLQAPGYAFGYPYEVATGAGTLHLVRPRSPSELLEAARAMHYSGPVYALDFDEVAFQNDGKRRYSLRELTRLRDGR